MSNTVRNVITISRKELHGYFSSPVAWLMTGLFALIFGWFFINYLDYFVRQSMSGQMGGAQQPMNVNDQMIRPLFSNASVIVLFLLPMITMRTYSEEKRSGTIELLLTSPVTDVEIILGKFIGALGLFAALIAPTLLCMGTLFIYGTPEWKPLLSGYLGLLLMGGSFIALGLFISSTTKNQMVAGSVTFVLLLLLWVINWMADSAGPTTGAILSYLSITQHFDDFARGIIDTKHVIFYLSFISFGLFLTLKSVDTERWRG
jgi:ABC-2 type transport system permease protein